jgi:hypothetical protein
LLNLGLCYSESHQIASAWSTYREAAALAARQGQADREAHARSKADELDDRLTRIRLVVSEEVLALPGLSVRVAGVEVSGVLLEEPFPVDAGTIEVVASATGYEETTLSIDAQKEGVTVDVPIESLQQVGARDDEAAAQDKDEQPSERKEGGGGGWQRPVGWAAVGVGTAGIATGVVTGLIAQSKYKSLDCANDVCTDPEDESGVNTVNTMRTVSPVAFIVGGVLAVAGVTLVLTAPKAEQVASLSPYVALDGVGLWGSF